MKKYKKVILLVTAIALVLAILTLVPYYYIFMYNPNPVNSSATDHTISVIQMPGQSSPPTEHVKVTLQTTNPRTVRATVYGINGFDHSNTLQLFIYVRYKKNDKIYSTFSPTYQETNTAFLTKTLSVDFDSKIVSAYATGKIKIGDWFSTKAKISVK